MENKNKKLPEITDFVKLYAEILVHRGLDVDAKKVFDIVDYDLGSVKRDYFEPADFVDVELSRVSVYEQLENVNCSPVEAFNSIGNLKDIAFASDKYIEKLVEQYKKDVVENKDVVGYKNILYLGRFGTFFIYKNKQENIILAQLILSEDDNLEMTFFKYEDYRASLYGMNRTRFVVFSEKVSENVETSE